MNPRADEILDLEFMLAWVKVLGNGGLHFACGTAVNFGRVQRVNYTGLNSVSTYLIGSPKIHVHMEPQNVTIVII